MIVEFLLGAVQLTVFVTLMVACCLAGLTDKGDR